MRGPRITGGAAVAALLLFLVLAPGGVAAAGGEAAIGPPSSGGLDYRAAAIAESRFMLNEARAALGIAQDALVAAQAAAAVAEAPLALQDTATRCAALVAQYETEVATCKQLLQAAIHSANTPQSQPAAANGASGSGLRTAGRSAKRAQPTESEEEDGIDPDESTSAAARGKRAARLEDLPRTIPTPTLGFIDAEGKIHRKHAVLAQELGVNLTLAWTAADAASGLLADCTRCMDAGTTMVPQIVQGVVRQLLIPVVELIRSYTDRGEALNIEHKFGAVVAREYVGDDLPTATTDHRRLRRAQAAAREIAARTASASRAQLRTPRLARVRGNVAAGGGRGAASGANAAALGGGGRGRSRGGGRGGGGLGPCWTCGGAHIRENCPNGP